MIPGLPTVGGMELLIILGVILLFFGAKRIPELARSLGKGSREFRKGINEGATEDETQGKVRKKEDQEKPPSDEASRDEMPQAEAETTHVGQKA
jgi:sec-independent protein translocase protein TatA